MEVNRHAQNYLKSNMDRFIEKEFCRTDFIFKDLKSNMDRFIAIMYCVGI